MDDLKGLAKEIERNLDAHFTPEDGAMRQVLALAEEVGEFVGAYRRAIGWARRTGSMKDVERELADVVITAYVTAEYLNIDLAKAIQEKSAIILTRGWKDER